MLNSAGDRFETDVIVERTIRTCNITFNTPLAGFDPKGTGDFINTINKVQLNLAGSVFPPRMIKCLSYDSSVQQASVIRQSGTEDVLFNQNSVSVAYDPFTWDGIILDIGNNQVGIEGRINDANLVPYANPQRLNGAGIRLIDKFGIANQLDTNVGAGDLRRDVDRSVDGVMAFLNYKKYNEVDLKRIGL